MYKCQYCSYCCSTWRLYTRHVFESHSSVPNFSFVCGINGCTRTFCKYSTIKSHIARKHCDVDLDTVEVGRNTSLSLESSVADNIEDSTPESIESQVDSMEVCADCIVSSNQMQKTAALYLLTLKERYKITQTAVDFVVSQTKHIVDNVVTNLCSAAEKEIKKLSCLNDEDASGILSVFTDVRDPFLGLETHYLQCKFYEEYFGFLVSIFLTHTFLYAAA